MTEVQQQRLHELLVQQMTRAVPVAVRVARHPLPERHSALHVDRLVLSMSKYLIRLSNTSANDISDSSSLPLLVDRSGKTVGPISKIFYTELQLRVGTDSCSRC